MHFSEQSVVSRVHTCRTLREFQASKTARESVRVAHASARGGVGMSSPRVREWKIKIAVVLRPFVSDPTLHPRPFRPPALSCIIRLQLACPMWSFSPLSFECVRISVSCVFHCGSKLVRYKPVHCATTAPRTEVWLSCHLACSAMTNAQRARRSRRLCCASVSCSGGPRPHSIADSVCSNCDVGQVDLVVHVSKCRRAPFLGGHGPTWTLHLGKAKFCGLATANGGCKFQLIADLPLLSPRVQEASKATYWVGSR